LKQELATNALVVKTKIIGLTLARPSEDIKIEDSLPRAKFWQSLQNEKFITKH